MQLTHYTSKFKKRNFPITLICDNVTNAPNLGGLFRISDAFGIEKIVLCGTNISLGRKMTKTSRATEKSVSFEIHTNALEVVQNLKKKGKQIIALEITEASQPIHEIKFNIKKSMVLVVGDENFGVSNEIIQLSDTVIHIDMFGQNTSMNVVQATNIALYEITRQFL